MSRASRRRRDADVHGIAVIDKPAGMTSHDVVARLRRVWGTSRVGHSGTLDPDATGVLVIGAGHYTRVLPYLAGLHKTYVGWAEFGQATDTLDAAGAVVRECDMNELTEADVVGVLDRFRGEILQVPPMVSARRVRGERLHEIARRGEVVEREARPVTIYTLDLLAFAAGARPRAQLQVECSTGTYIRTLVADLGEALDGCGHLSGLRRLAIGPFTAARASLLDDPQLLEPEVALAPLNPTRIDAETTEHLRLGRRPVALGVGADLSGPWAALDAEGALVAVVEVRAGQLVPLMVVPA